MKKTPSFYWRSFFYKIKELIFYVARVYFFLFPAFSIRSIFDLTLKVVLPRALAISLFDLELKFSTRNFSSCAVHSFLTTFFFVFFLAFFLSVETSFWESTLQAPKSLFSICLRETLNVELDLLN